MELRIIKVIMYVLVALGVFYLISYCFFPDLPVLIEIFLLGGVMLFICVTVEKIKVT